MKRDKYKVIKPFKPIPHIKKVIGLIKKKDYITYIKKRRKCQGCGFSDWRCLVFHHIKEKKFEMGDTSGLWKHSLEEIKKEIKKCIVLCANCHIIIHREEWEENKMARIKRQQKFWEQVL